MPSLLYIHGFLSSPQSHKARQVKQWLQHYRPDIAYHCPQLTPYPEEVHHTLSTWIEEQADHVYLIGSSMGGFWATYFAETLDLPAVIINPAVAALDLMPGYTNQRLKSYYGEQYYTLTDQHIKELARFDIGQIHHPENLWALLQTGDETLDYRLAKQKYQHCKLTIEQGGNHSFTGFERFLPEAITFLETATQKPEQTIA